MKTTKKCFIMLKGLTSSFGLVFIFGFALILICLYSQDNILAAITPRPDGAKFFNDGQSLKASTVEDDSDNHFRVGHLLPKAAAVLDSVTEDASVVKNGITSLAKSEASEQREDWPYDSPVILGWEPDKSTNISLYLQPDTNTTLIMPR